MPTERDPLRASEMEFNMDVKQEQQEFVVSAFRDYKITSPRDNNSAE